VALEDHAHGSLLDAELIPKLVDGGAGHVALDQSLDLVRIELLRSVWRSLRGAPRGWRVGSFASSASSSLTCAFVL